MKLIIIESPGKIHSFKKVLGSEYEVFASVGHCLDLPKKSLAVDIKNNFLPTLEVLPDKKEIVKNLKLKAKKASIIYLATDEDREGTGIAKNLYDLIKDDIKVPVLRVVTHEITKKGIENGIKNASQIDEHSYNAYMCRRILDRLCGYKTSFLTKQATGGVSAGRVQSAILRIMVDRELEIQHFVPEEYWILTAFLLSPKGDPYTAFLTETIKVSNAAQADKIYDSVIKGTPLITDVDIKEVSVNAQPPFTTMAMMASASTLFGWTADRTMKVAQGLYENSLITYHRTDSPTMSCDAIESIRCLIPSKYSSSYLPDKPNFYAAKSGAQEAHECCRPVDVTASVHVGGDGGKLYDLIWRRAVASQMKSGRDEKIKVITRISDYDFVSKGSRVLFDGFRKVWHYSSSDDVILPVLKVGENPKLNKLEKEQKFTSPPSRFSDASLGKKCEAEQIARPATFANFTKILQDRGYVVREKKSFCPTPLGMKVIDFLKSANVCFVDIKFTADMEKFLDEISENKRDKVAVLTEFWERLQKDIVNGNKLKLTKQQTEFKCPKCGGVLLSKNSQYGQFFSCENYKKEGGCTFKANVGPDGKPMEVVQKPPAEILPFKCEKCGSKMLKRKGSYGEFAGCSKYPSCHSTATLDGVFNKPKKNFKKFSKKKKSSHEE